jgi:hypothetical protein
MAPPSSLLRGAALMKKQAQALLAAGWLSSRLVMTTDAVMAPASLSRGAALVKK